MILCGFDGCRGGNFSRPYRNFYPPPPGIFTPPLWGSIIFHHRRPSALPQLILKKSIPGAVKIMLPRRGSSPSLCLYENLPGFVGCLLLYSCRTLSRTTRRPNGFPSLLLGRCWLKACGSSQGKGVPLTLSVCSESLTTCPAS